MDKALFLVSGRMACDPDFKKTQSGLLLSRFAIAVATPKSNDRDLVSFFECIAWRDVADKCNRFRKGDSVEAWGEFYLEKYTDKNGNQRTMLMLNVEKIFWTTGSGERNEAVRTKNQKKSVNVEKEEGAKTESAPEMIDAGDDDLPF